MSKMFTTARRHTKGLSAAGMEELEGRLLMSVITDPALGAYQFRLTVDLATGAATVTNKSAGTLRLTCYQIKSTAGVLDSAGWTSIADAAGADDPSAVVAALGTGVYSFGELGGTSYSLAEASLSGTARLTAGSSWSIGNPVTPAAAQAGDLTWYYLLSTTPGGDMCAGEVVILAPATTITVDPLTTADNRPALSGTVSDPAAAVTVTVNGHTYTSAVNHGDGTWTLADDAIAAALADGTYDVTATASVGGQVVATDKTADELVVAGGAVVVAIAKTQDATEANGTTTGKGVFIVTRAGGDFSQNLTVYYAIDDSSTATDGDDFAALTGLVVIPAGQASATIDVLAAADGLAEPTETLSLSLSSDEAYDLGTASASMTIADNSPTVSIAKTSDATEANGATTGKGVFTVTRAGGDMTQDLTVYYAVDDSSTAANGDDFAALTGVVVIPAGQASITIDVLAVSDGLVEPTETLSLSLASDAAYHLGTASASMTIADNSPTVSIARTKDASEVNGTTTGKGVFTVTRAGGDMTQDLTVYYTIDGGSTAANGDDFAALTGVVVIPAGQASVTIDVLAVNDGLAESAETLSLTLAGDAGYNLGTASASLQISDGGPAVSIVKTRDVSEADANSSRRGQFTVTRAGGSLSQALVVSYTVNAGSTAASGADFTALSGTVTIPAGRSSATISVQAIADGLVEPDETLTVDLSAAEAYLVARDAGSATMTIADSSPAVSIVKTRDTGEADGLTGRRGQFTVTRTGGSLSQALVVNYTVSDSSTATSGADYSALSGTVTIPAGKSSVTIYVQAIDDGLVESAETLTLALSADARYRPADGRSTATMTITDNSPTVSISRLRDAREAGGLTTGRGQFTITRAGGNLSQALVVNYAVDGASTAVSGADFVALAGSVTIPAGKSSVTLYVQAIDDGLAESTEALTLGLAASEGYRIAPARASATIAIFNNPLATLSRLGAPAPTDDIWAALHLQCCTPAPAPALAIA